MWADVRGHARVRVIVVGAGEVGYHVADRLSKELHDVVVVDVRADRLEYVESHLDVAVVEGRGASLATLTRAGIDEASILLAVTSVDEVNLVACMTVRDRKELVRVARVSNPDFYRDNAQLRPEQFSVEVLINPERELALDAFRLLESAAATDVAEFAGGAVQLVGLNVTPDAPIAGRRLADISRDLGEKRLLTVAIQRDGETSVPAGASSIKAGDRLYVVAERHEIPQAMRLCGYEQLALRRAMIAGGSLEAFYLGQLLQERRVQAIMIVKERARAQELAEQLQGALVLNGDATDVELLELEGVGDVDRFVALTDEDERNILSSLVAKHAGARQVVTLINRTEYVPVARRVGIDAAVSPRLSAANAILRYVRHGNVTRVATFKDIDAEATSFRVGPSSPLVDRPLSEAGFPDGAIVAAITRGREVIVPRGQDTLHEGDLAIVFMLPEAVAATTQLFPT